MKCIITSIKLKKFTIKFGIKETKKSSISQFKIIPKTYQNVNLGEDSSFLIDSKSKIDLQNFKHGVRKD